MEIVNMLVAEFLPMVEGWLRDAISEEVRKALTDEKAQTKPEPLLTREEVCALLHFTKPTLWRKTKSGELRAVHVGKRVLYPQSEVKKLMR